MNVYHYDLEGYYQGQSEAYPDPMSPGNFLVPAYATLIAPSQPGENQVAKWNGSVWELVSDPAWTKAQEEAAAQAAKEAEEAAAAIEAAKFVIFFRSRSGYDQKVITGASLASVKNEAGEPTLGGKDMDHADNQYVDCVVLDSEPSDWAAKNERSIALKKVQSGAIANRTQAAIDKDKLNKAWIARQAELDIAEALETATGQDADYTTHLMISQRAMDIKINAGAHTAEEVTWADSTLATYRSVFATVQGIRTDRDAAIALLDAEF